MVVVISPPFRSFRPYFKSFNFVVAIFSSGLIMPAGEFSANWPSF